LLQVVSHITESDYSVFSGNWPLKHKMCVLWRAPDTACSRVCWSRSALGSTCKCFVCCSYPVKLKCIQLYLSRQCYTE